MNTKRKPKKLRPEAIIVAVFNAKGGAGKTTVSVNLAGTLANMGYQVQLVDLDPQGSATIWAGQGEGNIFKPLISNLHHLTPQTLGREVLKYAPVNDFIIIDCPPALNSPMPSAALIVADLAIVPFKPAGLDVWAMEKVYELLEHTKVQNPTLIARGLSTMKLKSAVGNQLLSIMKNDPERRIEFFETEINNRPAYQEAQLVGATVHAVPRASVAAQEVNSLVAEVIKLFKGEK